MASRLLTVRPLRPFTLAALFTTSSIILTRSFTTQRPLLCDSASAGYFPFNSVPRSPTSTSSEAPLDRTSIPLLKDGGLNPEAMRQISTGSLIGLVCGLGVSVFSKPLTLLIGLLIGSVYMLEARGIHIVPYKRIQKYVKGIDLTSVFQENLPRKIAFGTTFALAGFGSFAD